MCLIDEDPKFVLIAPGSRIKNLMFQAGFTSFAIDSVKPSRANLLSKFSYAMLSLRAALASWGLTYLA
jgi:hypothetical protein